jgi:hypothetical protein
MTPDQLSQKIKETQLNEIHLMPHQPGCKSLNPVTSGDCDCYKAKRAEEINNGPSELQNWPEQG